MWSCGFAETQRQKRKDREREKEKQRERERSTATPKRNPAAEYQWFISRARQKRDAQDQRFWLDRKMWEEQTQERRRDEPQEEKRKVLRMEVQDRSQVDGHGQMEEDS